MLLRLGRSVDLKGSERSATVVDLLSFDSEKELVVCRALRDDERWPVQVLSTKRTEQQRLQEGWRQRVGVEAVVCCRWGKEELLSEQRKSERMAVDDPWVSAVSQRSCPRTNDDRSYRLTAKEKKKKDNLSYRERGSDTMLEIPN
ncbi:hypothetical protein BHM03_00050488 [Ensete ventricosum]|nr:hypothetical protein BHM03_00050488 [Ensete ventricosum]